jgi:hypothetical protein
VVDSAGSQRSLRWRIDALRRHDGEPTERVLARHFAPPPADGDDVVSDDQHRWMERVVASARSVHADFLVVADAPRRGSHPGRIQLLDERASIALEVHAEWVGITPHADYSGDAASGFALMWQVCQVLERDANCVIVDPADLAVIEMQLDAVQAREEYGWI